MLVDELVKRCFSSKGSRVRFHYILINWQQAVKEAVWLGKVWEVDTSKEGRQKMYAFNRKISGGYNLLNCGSFPAVNTRTNSPTKISHKRVLMDCVRNALFASYTGRLPGPSQKRRDAVLRRVGLFR